MLSPKQITLLHLRFSGAIGLALKTKVVFAEAAIHLGSAPSGSLVVKVNSTEPFVTSANDGVYFGVKLVALSKVPVPLEVQVPLDALPLITAVN